jgi:hypothetical protein
VIQVLIALDQLLHTLVGGMADETLSAAAYRWERDGIRSWPRKLIDTLLWFDENHCEQSYISELQRKQLPGEYRGEV